MKPLPLVFVAVMAMATSLRSQEKEAPASGVPVAAPLVLPTTARILGDIPDGTPPPPQPPKPKFIVPARDILTTTTQQQGGRTITLNRIKPIALPPPPEPAPAVDMNNPAFQERLAESQEHPPKSDRVMLGATIYGFNDSPARTLVRYRSDGEGKSITFWSSADFALLSGVSSFVATDGDPRTLFLMWSRMEVDRMADLFTVQSREYYGSNMPSFPDGPATFAMVGEQPDDPSALVPIQSLHDLYNSEYARLKAAWEGRERARIEREAWLKANPPQPKNIVLNYWRVEKPAPAKGANR